MEKPKDQSSQMRSESYYMNLVSSLRWFFNLRIVFLIISSLGVILFMNQLTSMRVINYEFPISEHTKQHINHFFFQAQSQAKFITKTINQIIQIQHKHYLKHHQLYYFERKPPTNFEKMVFTQKYGTTGEYQCLNGKCKSIQFYLVNLWAKRNYYNSVETVYIKYYDPIENLTNIVYTPRDLNQLTRQEVELMMNSVEERGAVQKIKGELYFKVKEVYGKGNDKYEVSIAIGLSKPEIMRILKSDIELNSFYQYALSDNVQWINFQSGKSLPRFAYRTGETLSQISYVSKCDNNTLITFYFCIPQVMFFFDFMKVSVLFPVLIIIFHFFKQRKIYRTALDKCFRSTKTLISLYEFNIQQIFTGKTPKHSSILNETTATQFYQELSQIPSIQYQPITHSAKVKLPMKDFAFPQILKAIVEKYNLYAKGIFREKNKEIISNKFFIHSSVNEISESESLKIKEAFTKARQLGFVKRFFYFAYLSLLLNPREFDRLIQQDKSTLPQQYIKLTREINRTVSSSDVRKAFKLSPNTRKQTEEQLEMRIQINLLHKYLQILKDLDIHNSYAKELELEDDLENIGNYIENIKHVLNKHNKNIRTFGK